MALSTALPSGERGGGALTAHSELEHRIGPINERHGYFARTVEIEYHSLPMRPGEAHRHFRIGEQPARRIRDRPGNRVTCHGNDTVLLKRLAQDRKSALARMPCMVISHGDTVQHPAVPPQIENEVLVPKGEVVQSLDEIVHGRWKSKACSPITGTGPDRGIGTTSRVEKMRRGIVQDWPGHRTRSLPAIRPALC